MVERLLTLRVFANLCAAENPLRLKGYELYVTIERFYLTSVRGWIVTYGLKCLGMNILFQN